MIEVDTLQLMKQEKQHPLKSWEDTNAFLLRIPPDMV